jgi:hypothetical protein
MFLLVFRELGVGIVWTAWVRFQGGQDFSLLHSVQTESGVHRTPYPMGTGGSFTGDKAAEK